MKKIIFFLLISLIVPQLSGQKKSKQSQPDARDLKIDSLTNSNNLLTIQLDSVSGELVKYMSVYNTIKEKVIHYDFDPTRSSFLIDSLKSVRDSTALLAMLPKTTASADSISMLLRQTTLLKEKADSIRAAWEKFRASISTEEMDKVRAVNNLKQLKELYDNKIISETEFIMLKKKYLEKL
jgi:hypothetical protein